MKPPANVTGGPDDREARRVEVKIASASGAEASNAAMMKK
jgi:hypothetical protein